MHKIKETIIVEGVYDKIKLSQIIDATIITTEGFAVLKDKEKMNLIRLMAEKTGIVILTDSDMAGFRIRNYIKQSIPNQYIKNAYIPNVEGVERRKTKAGKERLKGVEGIDNEIILKALAAAGCSFDNEKYDGQNISREITKALFYEDGLIGGKDSSLLRKELATKLNLPKRITANSLLDVLNRLYTLEEYREIVQNTRNC